MSLGELMSIVDQQSRWVYSSSLKSSRCSQKIKWNILSTVYPVSPEIMYIFRKRLRKAGVYHTLDQANQEVNSLNDKYLVYVPKRELA